MSNIVISLVLVLLCAGVSTLSSRSLKTNEEAGTWQPITNIKDPHVTEIAQFVVNEYNKKQSTVYELVKIYKGETQAVDGIKYRLFIGAEVNGCTIPQSYMIVVLEQQSTKQLLRFIPIPSQ
ncbi:hypothetical protein vseg_011530 [Gypsophila vaccaria]